MTRNRSQGGLAVETRGLTKRYGDLTAVDHLDLEVQRGQVLALLGPNGAGKTTTVRMLATLELPTSGHANVCGFDVVNDSEEVRRRFALTGQFAALEDNLTCQENLVLVARLRGMTRRDAKATADELIGRFEIGEFQDKLVKHVSGGQRRRVDLAASLVTRPELLVLDEPTTGLDIRARQVVWATIKELVAGGITLLLTTQYLEEADLLADSIVLIDHGRAVARGTTSELKSQIGQQRVDVVASDDNGYQRLVEGLGPRYELGLVPERRSISIPAPGQTGDLNAISGAIAELSVAVEEVALRHPTLDDAFLALTGDTAAATKQSQPRERMQA